MRKPQTAAQIERKRQRKLDQMMWDMSGWVKCGWCGNRFNPPRVRRWLGKKICPKCELFPTHILHKMVKFKIVKLRKKSKLPPYIRRVKRTALFDPKRPWLKWVRCEFCSNAICVNNYPDRRTRITKYKGHIICPWCADRIRVFRSKLSQLKYLKDPK